MSEEKKTPEKKAPEKKKKLGFFGRVAKWFRELRSELKKVTWPSRAQIINNTWVALVVMFVCAIAIWGFDYVAGLGVRTLFDVLG